VGGHAGVLTTNDGSLIIKPALPLELEFYQTHVSEASFEPLRPFLPKFYGTLKLEGKLDENNTENLAVMPVDEPPERHKDKCLCYTLHLNYLSCIFFIQSLVLENLGFAFNKPNILDIKLGTVLHDLSATPEKRDRMENTARMTTSLETGVRLTGFQVSS